MPRLLGCRERRGLNMTKHNARSIARVAGSYAFVWSLGNVLGCIVWCCRKLGIIKVRGYKRAMLAARTGCLIIAANHPSLLETIFIAALFWPRCLFDQRLYPWNMPDRNLFPRGCRWMFGLLHCIAIERERPADKLEEKRRRHLTRIRGTQRSIALLQDNGVIVVHPEGGRTSKGTEFRYYGGRRIRRIRSAVPWVAHQAGARILPLWIGMRLIGPKHTGRALHFGDGLRRLFNRRYHPVIVSFGEPYRTQDPFILAVENEVLEYKILIS